MDTDSIRQLQTSEAFPHPVQAVELVETHISWVLLTGEFAYKIKKPANFGFLDFSTLAQRQHFCQQELTLNRRYTPELYLDVVPVTGSLDAPRVGGDGPVLDYAVKMRQFDGAALLSTVSERGELDAPLVRAIAAEVARSHEGFPALTSATDNPAAMEAAMAQNFEQMREFAVAADELAALDRLEAWTVARVSALMPLMRARVSEGHVKDLHGDLHLSNMIVDGDAVRFFDCIEFNEDFRRMDTIAEIAFLAMDMANRGEAAQQVLNDYFEFTGDYSGLPLLDLYRVYFAMVRAKVSLMQEPVGNAAVAQTPAYDSFKQFLALGESYLAPRPAAMVLMHGVSGSGKSTVAAALAEPLGALRLRADVERKRLFGLGPADSSEALTQSIYTAEASAKTFARLGQLSTDVLAAGFPCIVDATFLHRELRAEFAATARAAGATPVVVNCLASDEALLSRLEQRAATVGEASEADAEVMRAQRSAAQPLAADESAVVIDVDTEAPLDMAALGNELAALCSPFAGDEA